MASVSFALGIGIVLTTTTVFAAEPPMYNVTLDDFVVFYARNASHSMQASDAESFCKDSLNATLASVHSDAQMQQLIDTFEDIHSNLSLDIESKFYLGVHCTADSFRYWHSNLDGTQFDFPTALVNWNWWHYRGCIDCFVLQRYGGQWTIPHDSREACNDPAFGEASYARGLVCNAHSDSDWQSMNPEITTQMSCVSGDGCSLQCNSSQPCYNRDYSIGDSYRSVNIDCEGGLSCAGLSCVFSFFMTSDISDCFWIRRSNSTNKRVSECQL